MFGEEYKRWRVLWVRGLDLIFYFKFDESVLKIFQRKNINFLLYIGII